MNDVNSKMVIVGASGYWGSILTRNAIELFGADKVLALDVNRAGLTALVNKLRRQGHLGVNEDLESSTDLGAVLQASGSAYFVVATPPKYHYEVARQILEQSKDVLLTKPMTLSVDEALALEKLAVQNKVVVMVDHTFLFHPAVETMIREVKTGRIGKPKTIYAEWLSRGKIQEGADVIWDLAPHPLSILLEFWQFPIDVHCKINDVHDGIPTEATLFLTEKSSGNSAVIHVSWMDGHKTRLFKIRGSHHTIVFDDTCEMASKLVIKGGKTDGHPLLSNGYHEPVYDIRYPHERPIEFVWEEPLKKELLSFINLAQNGSADARSNESKRGIACVKLIETAQQSVQQALIDAAA